MYLFINTADRKKITLALVDKQGKIFVLKNIKAEYQQSEKLLSTIEKIITKHSVRASSAKTPDVKYRLSGVMVVVGPGGFSSLRIGVATANALAWALQIPVVSIGCDGILDNRLLIERGFKKIKKMKKFKQVLPEYGKAPNITYASAKK